MFKFETSVLNSEGQPIVGATVSIFAAGSNTLVQLFEDDQTTTKFNPLTTDSTGLVQCKAANGKYDYLVSNLPGGATRRINGVIFDDPTEAGSASISLSMPGEYTVSGSPGNNLTVSKKTQIANTFYRGPKTGLAATPTFDTIVIEDLPVPSQAQAEFGANATTVMTPERTGQLVTAWTGFTKRMFTSNDQTYSNASTLSIPHGLGATPKEFTLYMRVLTAFGGYAAGDVIKLDSSVTVNTNAYGQSVYANATDVKVVIATAIYVIQPSTSGLVQVTPANVRLFVTAKV